MMDSDGWESDGEFEASILQIETKMEPPSTQPPSCHAPHSQATSSAVSVYSKVKTEPSIPKCSTPRPAAPRREQFDIHREDLSCSLSTILSETSPHTGRKGAPIMQSTPVPQSKSDVQRCDTPGVPSGCSSSNKKRRKFPGPAGTLPKLRRDMNLKALKDVRHDMSTEDNLAEEIPLSQGSQPLSVTAYSAWRCLISDLELSTEHLRKHSISNAMTNASKKQLPDGKAPLLVVVIETINKTLPDATVSVKDLTGAMHGVIHRLLVKQHNDQLKIGSALLLKHCTVFSPTLRRQYLNITPNNMLQVYSEDDKTSEVTSTNVTKSSIPIETLLTQPISGPPKKPNVTPRVPTSTDLFTSPTHANIITNNTPVANRISPNNNNRGQNKAQSDNSRNQNTLSVSDMVQRNNQKNLPGDNPQLRQLTGNRHINSVPLAQPALRVQHTNTISTTPQQQTNKTGKFSFGSPAAKSIQPGLHTSDSNQNTQLPIANTSQQPTNSLRLTNKIQSTAPPDPVSTQNTDRDLFDDDDDLLGDLDLDF